MISEVAGGEAHAYRLTFFQELLNPPHMLIWRLVSGGVLGSLCVKCMQHPDMWQFWFVLIVLGTMARAALFRGVSTWTRTRSVRRMHDCLFYESGGGVMDGAYEIKSTWAMPGLFDTFVITNTSGHYFIVPSGTYAAANLGLPRRVTKTPPDSRPRPCS